MSYQMGATQGALQDVETVFGFGPRSTYAPGREEVVTVSGLGVYIGYPRVTWTFAALSVAQWQTLKTTLGGGGLSAVCYIQTRNDLDVWGTYQAISRLPNPETLERWGGHYRDVVVEFSLLEAV
jgi:hypothetical protein